MEIDKKTMWFIGIGFVVLLILAFFAGAWCTTQPDKIISENMKGNIINTPHINKNESSTEYIDYCAKYCGGGLIGLLCTWKCKWDRL